VLDGWYSDSKYDRWVSVWGSNDSLLDEFSVMKEVCGDGKEREEKRVLSSSKSEMGPVNHNKKAPNERT
jgi:hypothetical protein